MSKGRRSAERLFYWANMSSLPLARRRVRVRRPFIGRNLRLSMMTEVRLSFFLLLLAIQIPNVSWGQGPALTTIAGTVYRADGTAAAGTVLISWPSFQTSEGDAVAVVAPPTSWISRLLHSSFLEPSL